MISGKNITCAKRNYYKCMKQFHLKEWNKSCYVSNSGNKWIKTKANQSKPNNLTNFISKHCTLIHCHFLWSYMLTVLILLHIYIGNEQLSKLILLIGIRFFTDGSVYR